MYESLWTLPLAIALVFGLGFGIFRAMQPREHLRVSREPRQKTP
jgi:hypothetical protein